MSTSQFPFNYDIDFNPQNSNHPQISFNPQNSNPPQIPQNPRPPSIQVESLTLPDLMKNQHVQSMYSNWQDASTQVIQAAQMQQSLYKENLRLNAEVTALQEKHQQEL